MRVSIGLALAFCLAATAAQAGTGPCKPDSFGGLTCGEGVGAARVIEKTTSPSKIHAFAWRSTKTPPTEQPDDAGLENVLIRLSDGAIVATLGGDYWDTGTVHVNRTTQHAAWSPASRFVVEIVDFRWMTMVLRIYALGPDGAVKTLDVKDAMEAAARKLLRKMVRNEDDYAFSVLGASNGETPHLTVGNDGAIKAVFLMQIPKAENKHAVIEGAFRVTDRGGSLALKELSLRRSKIKPW